MSWTENQAFDDGFLTSDLIECRNFPQPVSFHALLFHSRYLKLLTCMESFLN